MFINCIIHTMYLYMLRMFGDKIYFQINKLYLLVIRILLFIDHL